MKKTYKYSVLDDVYTVWLDKMTYANGRTVLLLMDREGQVACATMNLPEHDIEPDEIIVKTWSENESMLKFLVRNRICADTGRDIETGLVKARVCRLLI
jgi:hypothetical protein